MNMHAILQRPVVTEKATGLAEKSNTVTFEVESGANKYQIRDAVQATYGVKVIKVHTLIGHGKLKRRGSSIGRRPNTKKARVTLRKGDTIDFYATE
jgi:large subunit ribosomal protein L23